MATYVMLIKDYEDNEKVIYKFSPDDQTLGRVELNKITKEYIELEPVPNTKTAFYYNRAVSRLLRCLNDEKGIFPEHTHYAS